MTRHLGDFDASAVIYGKFTTFRPSTGAAFTLGGTPALSVYKDNSVTQSTTGVTLTADFDSVTGLNHFAIDTSADGTFYSAGSFFDIVITTGTVDSVSVVGSVVGGFTLRKTSALKPTTAGRTLVVDASGLADANMVKAGPTGSGTAQTARDIGGAVPAAAAGASGGLLISGSNSGTTTLGALTVTGATTMTGGLAVAAGATITGSATGAALTLTGGGTSGEGLKIVTTAGDGILVTPTAGNAATLTANGTSKHGIVVTGGTAGTSDGIKAAAGTGGVDIRGNITGNLVGTVSTLTTYTGNTPQTGDSFARLGAPAGASTAADIAAVKVDTAAVKAKTDNLAFTVANQVDANVLTVAGAASNIKKNQQLVGFEFLMTDSTNHNPATGLTVTATRSIDGGAFGACANAVVEVGVGIYKITLAAADLNGNVITLRFTAAASDDQLITIVTQP